MYTRSLTFLILIFVGFHAWSQHPEVLSDQGWKLEKEKLGVSVSGKYVEGFEINAFKASGLVDADIAAVYNVIMDVENYPLWYPDISVGEEIESSDTFQLRRVVFKLPWPFYKRDVVNGFVSRKKEDGIYIEIYNAPDAVDEQNKVVRIPKSEGFWWLTPEGTKTRVIYSAVGDAPGIPAWIVNIFLYDSPITAIDNLREMAKKPEYQFIPDWLN